MAIKRCPYCRAIIDEKDQYCNNCGTQLLFPEDADAEEEIKGEKIVDEDVEDKDYEIPKPEDEESEKAESAEEEELEAGGAEPEEQKASQEEEEEVILVDEDKSAEAGAASTTEVVREEKAPEESPAGMPAQGDALPELPAEPSAELPAEGAADVLAANRDESRREIEEGMAEKFEEEAGMEKQVPAPKKPLTFDTRELDQIGRTAELGKEQIEKFLEVLKEREEESKARSIKPPEPEDNLPAWAREMKEQAPASGLERTDEAVSREEGEEREGPKVREPRPSSGEEGTEEEIKRPARRISDSGIGLPEKVTQTTLPFEKAIPREEIPAETKAGRFRKEEPYEEEAEGEEPTRVRPPFKLSVFLKAKFFDILFVSVFWLVSLWLAARSMNVTIFQMFSVVPNGLFILLGALLALYFFPFYFFLGETLGDRLFRDED